MKRVGTQIASRSPYVGPRPHEGLRNYTFHRLIGLFTVKPPIPIGDGTFSADVDRSPRVPFRVLGYPKKPVPALPCQPPFERMFAYIRVMKPLEYSTSVDHTLLANAYSGNLTKAFTSVEVGSHCTMDTASDDISAIRVLLPTQRVILLVQVIRLSTNYANELEKRRLKFYFSRAGESCSHGDVYQFMRKDILIALCYCNPEDAKEGLWCALNLKTDPDQIAGENYYHQDDLSVRDPQIDKGLFENPSDEKYEYYEDNVDHISERNDLGQMAYPVFQDGNDEREPILDLEYLREYLEEGGDTGCIPGEGYEEEANRRAMRKKQTEINRKWRRAKGVFVHKFNLIDSMEEKK
uniref:Uncharacterized protein n=1 Tax=Timema poppense TaxID=170557 RepID=A0A7R9H7A8_TIMPO|nr:unnamed protein product [Timema poppensis]